MSGPRSAKDTDKWIGSMHHTLDWMVHYLGEADCRDAYSHYQLDSLIRRMRDSVTEVRLYVNYLERPRPSRKEADHE